MAEYQHVARKELGAKKRSPRGAPADVTAELHDAESATPTSRPAGLPLFLQRRLGGSRSSAPADGVSRGAPSAATARPSPAPLFPLFMKRKLGGRDPSAALGGFPVSRPEDTAEREADRAAHALAEDEPALSPSPSPCCGGASCPKCSAKRRAPAEPAVAALPPVVRSTLGGPGQALSPSTQARLQPHFAFDLEAVKIHTDASAEASAESLGAAAYTLGPHIAFGAGRFAPETPEGHTLLAHELSHVGQQAVSGGAQPIQRSGDGDGGAGGASGAGGGGYDGASGAGGAGADGAAPPQLVGDFDPCAVDEKSLTHEAFLATWGQVEAYLGATKRGEGDYYAHANLMRRLSAEKRRRVQMGHVWLATGAAPEALYRVEPSGPAALDVSSADLGLATGAPRQLDSPIMTPAQFDAFLERQGVARMDVQTLLAQQDPNNPQGVQVDMSAAVRRRMERAKAARKWQQLFAPELGFPWQVGGAGVAGVPGLPPASSPFANVLFPSIAKDFNAPEALRGDLGKLSFLTQRGTISSNVDLDVLYQTYKAQQIAAQNQQRAANGQPPLTPAEINRQKLGSNDQFPLFDVAEPQPNGARSKLFSVKTMEPNPQGPPEFGGGGYAKDINQILKHDGQFNRALQVVSNQSGPLAPGALQDLSYLVVNADHEALFKDWVRGQIVKQHGQYADFIDSVLQRSPAVVDSVPYSSLEQLKKAKDRRTISQEGFKRALKQAADEAAAKVVGNQVSTPELAALVNLRQQYAAVSERAYGLMADPAMVDVALAGGGSKGRGAVAAKNAATGAKAGAAISGVMSVGNALLGDDHRPVGQQLAHIAYDTGSGAAAGYGAAWVETEARLLVGQAMLRSAQYTNVALEAALLGADPEVSAAATRLSSAAFGGLGAGGKVFVSGATGALVAPLVTGGGMLLDDVFFGGDHTSIDYESRMLRSAVAGGVSAGATAIVSGAIAGSVAGPVGTLIGLGVGTIVYLITDAAVGDEVEGWAREALGEGGCPR